LSPRVGRLPRFAFEPGPSRNETLVSVNEGVVALAATAEHQAGTLLASRDHLVFELGLL